VPGLACAGLHKAWAYQNVSQAWLEPGLDFQKPAKLLGTTHLRLASYLHQ